MLIWHKMLWVFKIDKNTRETAQKTNCVYGQGLIIDL